ECELALAVTQQDCYELHTMISDADVSVAIAIKVRRGNVRRILPGAEWRTAGLREAAFAISEIDCEVATPTIRDEHIELVVFINIRDADHRRMRVNRQMDCTKWSRVSCDRALRLDMTAGCRELKSDDG